MAEPASGPITPAMVQVRFREALALHQQGRLAQAKAIYERILQEHPQQADALHLLGMIALQSGDPATADRLISQALAVLSATPPVPPNRAIALHDRAHALQALGQLDAALACCDEAIALQPNFPEAYFSKGNLLQALNRTDAAAACYERAAALRSDLAAAHYQRGNELYAQGRSADALMSFDRAIALRPDHAESHNDRGNALCGLGRFDAALASYERAIALRPDYVGALNNRGNALWALGYGEEALASFERALDLQPNYVSVLNNRGNVLGALGRDDAALASFDSALALQPDYAGAWYNKGMLLSRLKRLEEAVTCLTEALRLQPGQSVVLGELQGARMSLCDWADFTGSLACLSAAIARGEMALVPLNAQLLFDSPALQLQSARQDTAASAGTNPLPEPFPPRPPGRKIRLGYFSADFREHAVAYLTAELFERHDRETFEVIGFALGPSVQDAMRQRLEKTFDRFIDVAHLSDQDVARLAREHDIDIAIDLGGHTQYKRQKIFSYRAAPVQVSYIGYLGTLGADFMDYLIADPVLIPAEQREHYQEKIAYLPWYQANDSVRQASDRAFTRAELGLPERGFVFACCNNAFKITPPVFERWMRILQQVPDSVLYLVVANDTARRNLRAEAEARGVDGARLVFADRVSYADYLARYRMVDLFLDTWPYNAGATASDALMMGVPVLTYRGQAFPARIAASVLTALGVPELITDSLEAYEQEAVRLARDPARLATLRQKVEQQRLTAPLFDTPRFTRHLEAAYTAMVERWRAGLPPEDIQI